jgi:molybdopterin-guanine dinucleotide biosynthesis protein B
MGGDSEKTMKLIGFITNNRAALPGLFKELLPVFNRTALRTAILSEELSCQDTISVPTATLHPDRLSLSLPGNNSIASALAYLSADIVLVDGFDYEKTFPRILLSRPDDFTDAQRDALLVTGTFIDRSLSGLPHASTPAELANMIREKAFSLPGLDCGHCGCATCYEFAREIIRGNRKPEECVSLQPLVRIKFGDFEMPMNPFISGIAEKTIRGMLSTLKGYRSGTIDIMIP